MDPTPARTVDDVLAKESPQEGGPAGILPVLLRIENAVGYVPPECLPRIARALGETDAQVGGVLSYYPDLHKARPDRHVVRVCLGEACLANHGSRVLRAVQDHLRAGVGETTADGRCTLEKVYCVGNCGVSPTVVVDGDIHGRVSPEQVPALLERYR